jgi:TRAP-type C4-dicarboxylate transport system permease small subunit
MDRFIDTIEWIAAGFVGIVALNIFISVVLRNTLNYAIPDSFDIGRMLLGILIFWGIAATSYRGGHITVDLIWANVGPKYQRMIDAGAVVRRDGADLDAVRQGARHLLRQRPYI